MGQGSSQIDPKNETVDLHTSQTLKSPNGIHTTHAPSTPQSPTRDDKVVADSEDESGMERGHKSKRKSEGSNENSVMPSKHGAIVSKPSRATNIANGQDKKRRRSVGDVNNDVSLKTKEIETTDSRPVRNPNTNGSQHNRADLPHQKKRRIDKGQATQSSDTVRPKSSNNRPRPVEHHTDRTGSVNQNVDSEDGGLSNGKPTRLKVYHRTPPSNKTKNLLRDQETQQASQNTPKARKSESRESQSPSKPTTSLGQDSGPFTQEEKETADRIFEEVRQRENLSVVRMRARVQSWKEIASFKKEITEALPRRPIRALRRFCQRRYHNLERGPWTEEQDEALRNAYAQQPDSWAKISDLVDRTAQDCRDRWKNHLQYGSTKELGPWSQQEEQSLTAVVNEAIDKVKLEYKSNPAMPTDKDHLVSLVNWHWVSCEHGKHRSSKSCREKYAKLRARAARNDSAQQAKTTVVSNGKTNTRRKAAMKELENFELGDFSDVLVEISTSISDHNKQFNDEDNVLWSIISQKNPNSIFNNARTKGMLRKVAYEEAMSWTSSWPTRARKELEKAPSVPAKALVLANWIESRDPDNTRPRKYMARQSRQVLSEAMIVDSDDEGDTKTREARTASVHDDDDSTREPERSSPELEEESMKHDTEHNKAESVERDTVDDSISETTESDSAPEDHHDPMRNGDEKSKGGQSKDSTLKQEQASSSESDTDSTTDEESSDDEENM